MNLWDKVEESQHTFHRWFLLSRHLTYYVSYLILLALTILSLVTLFVASSKAFNSISEYDSFFELTYLFIGKLVQDKAAWGAFGVTLAGLTFLSRHDSNDTQYKAYLVQKERWDLEKAKAYDESREYKSQKMNKYRDINQELSPFIKEREDN